MFNKYFWLNIVEVYKYIEAKRNEWKRNSISWEASQQPKHNAA